MKISFVESDAVISDCGTYRYLLRRVWDARRPRALFIMLNPTTADALVDDATIRSCVRLSDRLGYGSLEVVNLFAFRSTDPEQLRHCADPIGPRNDAVIRAAVARCDRPICAWGAHTMAVSRAQDVWELIRAERPAVFCFGATKSGQPKHPLYLPNNSTLQAYLSPDNLKLC